MKIYRASEATPQLVAEIAKLLPQLSSSATTPSLEYISTLIADKNTHLFVAEEDGAIAGMLSLVVVNIPTGRKAWIEDVVVDSKFRGENIGYKLVKQAKAQALNLGVKKLYLTSNPSRIAAHALYKKCEFEEYETTVFKLSIATK